MKEKKKVLEQERFKYENLINDTKEDVKNGYISEDEFREYTIDYKIGLKDVKHSIKNIEEQLKN